MTPVYKTLTGLHFLGMTESPSTIRDLLADGHIPAVAKFVQCDVGYIAGLHSSFPDDTAFIVRWVYWGNWNSDAIDAWLAVHPSIDTAALAWADMLSSNLSALASLTRTVYVETFNEAEISPQLCEFNVQVAKLLKARYGEDLKLAALSAGSGRYNSREQWQQIIDGLIRPLNAARIEFALSLHAYSSLAMPVWNGLGFYKHNIQEMYATGDPSKAIDLDTIPKVSLAAEPGAYTGFAHERAGYFLKVLSAPGERLHETPILLTETGIDAMQDPGIGTVAGGWREWWARGLWERVLRTGESPGSYMSRNLVYAERRYQAANAAGMNIQGATPFTYSDTDTFSRWFKEYRVAGEAWQLFLEKMKAINVIDAPTPEEETMADKFILYWPTQYMSINQAFGTRPEYYGNLGHEGLDIAASLNSIISSCATGVVKQAYLMNASGYNAYGNHIRIEHTVTENDKTVVYETTYAHLNVVQVKVSDVVKAGQQIGLAGSTGNSTGPHLHLNLKRKGAYAAGLTKRSDDLIDPTPYLGRDYAPTVPQQPELCTTKTTAALNVRSAPDTSKTNVIFTTVVGAILTPTHQFKANGEDWYRIAYSNKGTQGFGWVVSRFVSRPASCPALSVWVEPTPEPPPVPEPPVIHPDTIILAKIKPVLTRMRVSVVSLEDDVREALEIAGVTLE